MENLKKQENTVYTWRKVHQQCHIALQSEALLLRAVLREEDSPLGANSTPCIAHLSLLDNFLQLLQRWEFVLLFLQPSVSQLSLLQWHCCDLVPRQEISLFPFPWCLCDGALLPSWNLWSFLYPHTSLLHPTLLGVCLGDLWREPFCTFYTVKKNKPSLLRRSLCLNTFILLNFRVCSCTKPLLWSEHSSRDFQWNSSTRWGFFVQKGKEKLLQSDVITTESITSYGDCQIFRFFACLYSDFLELKSKYFKISSTSFFKPRF